MQIQRKQQTYGVVNTTEYRFHRELMTQFSNTQQLVALYSKFFEANLLFQKIHTVELRVRILHNILLEQDLNTIIQLESKNVEPIQITYQNLLEACQTLQLILLSILLEPLLKSMTQYSHAYLPETMSNELKKIFVEEIYASSLEEHKELIEHYKNTYSLINAFKKLWYSLPDDLNFCIQFSELYFGTVNFQENFFEEDLQYFLEKNTQDFTVRCQCFKERVLQRLQSRLETLNHSRNVLR